MFNPFATLPVSAAGPFRDIVPITPDNTTDLPQVYAALYVVGAGALTLVTEAGNTRTVTVAAGAILPVGVRKVNATGTTATGIFGLAVS